MDSYGEILRNARQVKGLDIDTVARETSIISSYIEGLENEDNSAFPGEAYLMGFLKNYSEYLEKNTDGLNDNKKAAAACAIQNATFAKGVEELGKVLDENAEQLNNLSNVSVDTFESVAKV